MSQRADKALIARRVHDLVRVVLMGGRDWDLCEHVRAQQGDASSPWHVPEGESELSVSQLRRYLRKANQRIEKSFDRSRKRMLRKVASQVQHLYAATVTSGNYAVALGALKELSALMSLYPRPEDELRKELDELREMLKEMQPDGRLDASSGNSPAETGGRAETATPN
jgi:hypothetical protein